MKEDKFKNMIILKDLPSNIVEEAIVILKKGTKVKRLEKIEKNRVSEHKDNKIKDEEYIVKEAEILVQNYISNIEKKENKKVLNNTGINRKYKKLKKYAYISTMIIFMQALILIIK